MKPFRVEMRVKHNKLYQLIRDKYGSVAAMRRETKLSITTIYGYLSLTRTPLKEGRTITDYVDPFRESAKKIATSLGVIPDEIWDEDTVVLLESNFAATEMTSDDIKALTNDVAVQHLLCSQTTSPDDAIDESEMCSAIDEILGTLRPRYRKVVEMRFGLGDYKTSHSFGEIGDELGINRERVRQIEAQALREFRRPQVAKIVSQWGGEQL